MEGITSPQRRAVIGALQLLRTANVPPDIFLNAYRQSLREDVNVHIEEPELELQPSLAIQKASYIPPKAVYFDEYQRAAELHRVTTKSYVSALIDHPEGAVVEYPEAGKKNGDNVAHRFAINPNDLEWKHPRANIQYSLGDKHGGRNDVECLLLRDSATGESIICKKRTYGCCSTKVCKFFDPNIDAVSPDDLQEFRKPWTAEKELFTKTLALFTLLQEHGCSSKIYPRGQDFDPENNSSSDTTGLDSAVSENKTCKGRLLLKKTTAGRYIIECEHRRKGHKSHLRLTDLHEYDLRYLSALLNNDTREIEEIENIAKHNGYGPLVHCRVMTPASARRQRCPEWHRFPCGSLERGLLHRDYKCDVIFDIYVPNEFSATRNQILIVCRNAHSHPRPAPTKTPPIYAAIFKSLLLNLSWKLADATPRQILLDSGFMSSLKLQLGWSYSRNPVLANLHPSFSNSDHVKRMIIDVRDEHFPMGTEYKGVKALCEQETSPENRYVRCVEEIESEGKIIRIIICMTLSMSASLMDAKRLTIDTSFKRVYGCKEFEIETWDDYAKRSKVVCRAFITSESSDAHLKLFIRIFAIAEIDTGKPVQFRHIHGSGIETIIADGHKGQALGLGLFCGLLCVGKHQRCSDCNKLLSDLDPYEHLMHIFRLCTVHFKRHIYDMRKSVSAEIIAAMLSIATTEVIPDLRALFLLIRSGGKKTSDWLDDKLVTSKFAFPGPYWPASKIPLEIWKASPATTNGNEQSHRNVNRDGVGLTLLAGVMRGMHYDKRAYHGIEAIAETGVQTRDEIATHHNRQRRAITRKARAQQRQLTLVDEQLKAIHEKIEAIKRLLKTTGEHYRKELLKRQTNGSAGRRVKKLREQLKRLHETASSLQDDGSGKITLELDEQEDLRLDEEQLAQREDEHQDTLIHYEGQNVEVYSNNVENGSLRSSPNPSSTLSVFTAPIPTTSTRTTQGFRFKEVVPNLAKWYK